MAAFTPKQIPDEILHLASILLDSMSLLLVIWLILGTSRVDMMTISISDFYGVAKRKRKRRKK